MTKAQVVTTIVVPNYAVAVVGDPKSGKTHFALTFPEPIALFSFDRGADFVVRRFPSKAIEVFHFNPPVQMSYPPAPFAEALWAKFLKEYRATVEGRKFKTIVLDTGTVLWEIIRWAYTEEESRTQIRARDYGEPNARMSWCLLYPVDLGHYVVTTQYLKDKYVDDKATGEEILDGFKRTEGLVDITIRSTAQGKALPTLTIKSSRFGPELNEMVVQDYQNLNDFVLSTLP